MAGTKAGGKRAAATNKERYGKDWYAKIGRKGGSKTNTLPKGFAANRELAKIAGAKGGKISSRKGIPNKKGSAKKEVSHPHLTDEDIEEAKRKKGWVWPFSRNEE